MPSRFLSRSFTAGTCYHLRHTAHTQAPLFRDPADYQSFLLTLSYYLRFPTGAPLSWVPRLSARALASKQGASSHPQGLPVTLHAFALLPDHFHLILTENLGGNKPGISELMRRLSVGYAMTYRGKYGGSGTIYHGKYKITPLFPPAHLSLVAWLHAHPATNPPYLKDPLHSSLSDYLETRRPWLKPLIFPSLPPPPISPTLTLE